MSYNPNGPRNNAGMSNFGTTGTTGTPGTTSFGTTGSTSLSSTDFVPETEPAEGLRAKAENLASNVKEKASHLGTQVSDKASAAMSTVSEKFSDMAGAVRDHVPSSVAPYAERAADTLERAGSYLKQHDLHDLLDDVTGIIRRHPMPSILTGVAIGFLLARTTRR